MDFDTFVTIGCFVGVVVCWIVCASENVRCTYKDQKIPQNNNKKKGAKK